MPGTSAITAVTASAASIAQAPAAAMAMTYLAMAESLGLAMANASACQQRGQVLGQAALTQLVALIYAKGSA